MSDDDLKIVILTQYLLYPAIVASSSLNRVRIVFVVTEVFAPRGLMGTLIVYMVVYVGVWSTWCICGELQSHEKRRQAAQISSSTEPYHRQDCEAENCPSRSG